MGFRERIPACMEPNNTALVTVVNLLKDSQLPRPFDWVVRDFVLSVGGQIEANQQNTSSKYKSGAFWVWDATQGTARKLTLTASITVD